MLRLFLLIVLLLPVSPSGASETVVPATDGALVEALKTVQAGDILRLSEGTYLGPIVIEVPLTLIGDGAVIDGQEVGSTITVNAPDVTLQGLTVIGSGSGGGALDAGITLTKLADNAVIEGNTILGNLIGIDVHGAKDVLVLGNIIEGRQSHRMNDRGNGVYVWNAPGAVITYNDIRYGRDGIFVNASRKNKFIGNRLRDLRFAIHYMYTQRSEVSLFIMLSNY